MMEVTAHNPKKDTWDVKLFTVCIRRVEECEQKKCRKRKITKDKSIKMSQDTSTEKVDKNVQEQSSIKEYFISTIFKIFMA